jgi:hypothetical protein
MNDGYALLHAVADGEKAMRGERVRSRRGQRLVQPSILQFQQDEEQTQDISIDPRLFESQIASL